MIHSKTEYFSKYVESGIENFFSSTACGNEIVTKCAYEL